MFVLGQFSGQIMKALKTSRLEKHKGIVEALMVKVIWIYKKKDLKNLKRIQGDKALLRKVTKEQIRKFTKVLDKE